MTQPGLVQSQWCPLEAVFMRFKGRMEIQAARFLSNNEHQALYSPPIDLTDVAAEASVQV